MFVLRAAAYLAPGARGAATLLILCGGLLRVFDRVLLFPAYTDSHNVVAFTGAGEPQMRLDRISPNMRLALGASAYVGAQQPPQEDRWLKEREVRALEKIADNLGKLERSVDKLNRELDENSRELDDNTRQLQRSR